MRPQRNSLPARARISLSATPQAEALAPDVALLYRAHAAKVGRWAPRLGGPSIEAEDVVQEVFLVAKRRLRAFPPDGGGSATTWLFRATDRLVKAPRRKQRLRRLVRAAPAAQSAG